MTGMPFTDVPLIHWLPDGKRLRMRHGPIELVVEAVGGRAEVELAYRQAVGRFRTVLVELVGELEWLRRSITLTPRPPLPDRERGRQDKNVVPPSMRGQHKRKIPSVSPKQRLKSETFEAKGSALQLNPASSGGPPTLKKGERGGFNIAKAMHQTATHFHHNQFITPMICVAGAVADHILSSMLTGRKLDKAYINNGGDIALYLASSQSFDIGVCDNPLNGSLASHTHITADSGIGGVATSGWRGRSHSLGIADAVTVLAHNAATADTAATLVANVIDLPGHPAIQREQASELQPDSDLGERLVTTDVGELAKDEIEQALLPGKILAQQMIDRGDIVAVYGSLQSGRFSISEIRATKKEIIHA